MIEKRQGVNQASGIAKGKRASSSGDLCCKLRIATPN
jgi:hypothetical protein